MMPVLWVWSGDAGPQGAAECLPLSFLWGVLHMLSHTRHVEACERALLELHRRGSCANSHTEVS